MSLLSTIGFAKLALVSLTLCHIASAHHLPVKRSDSAPIWGTKKVPDCSQIRERQSDCWLLSAACAVVKCNPAWLTSNVKITSGDESSTSEVEYTVFDSKQTSHTLKINYENDIKETINDDRKWAWWPAALDLSVINMGGEGVSSDGKLSDAGGAPSNVGLGYITGKETKYEGTFTDDEFWGWLQKADYTPIVIGTKPKGTTKLTGDHAYAVMTTRVDGDTNKVTLWEPNGAEEKEWTVSDIMPDINQMGHLKNWDSYTG